MMTSMTADDAAPARRSAGPLALASWMLFDWASQPFYTLVTTFLFAPYFASVFIGDAARGSALWGYAMAAAAVVVADRQPDPGRDGRCARAAEALYGAGCPSSSC